MQEKRAIKRSLSVRNEHHELALNVKMATRIIFQQSVNGRMGVSRQKKCKLPVLPAHVYSESD